MMFSVPGIVFILANSADPDETFILVFTVCQSTCLLVTRMKGVKEPFISKHLCLVSRSGVKCHHKIAAVNNFKFGLCFKKAKYIKDLIWVMYSILLILDNFSRFRLCYMHSIV